MIIIKVMGGLGNQLQQYALYDKMKSLGKEARLDLSWYAAQKSVGTRRRLELTDFPDADFEEASLEEVLCLTGQRTRGIAGGAGLRAAVPGGRDSGFARGLLSRGAGFLDKLGRKIYNKPSNIFIESKMYHPEIFGIEDGYLEGYWACEAYYHDRLPSLREKLSFPDVGEKNARMAAAMRRENSVSIHIRRGDYLAAGNAELFGGICTDEYYEAAIRILREETENPRFYVFSDDPAYARVRYSGRDFVYVDINSGADSRYDIYLMSQCRHNICANSTFSFWGARLNAYPGRIQIRPLKHKNSQPSDFGLMRSLWPGYRILDERGGEGPAGRA